MAVVPRKRRSTRKPTFRNQIDLSHPHLAGCVARWDFLENAGDYVKNVCDRPDYIGSFGDFDVSGAAAWRDDGVYCDNTNADAQPCDPTDQTGWQAAFTTLAVHVRCTLLTDSNGPMGLVDIGGQTTGFAVAYRNGPNTVVFKISSGGNTEIASSTNFVPDQDLDIWAIYDAGAMSLWVNGVLENTGSQGTSLAIHTDNGCVGGEASASAINNMKEWGGVIQQVEIFKVAPTEDFIQAKYRNPWAPYERRILLPVAATAETLRSATITGAGTVAATGKREVPRSATITGVGSVAATGAAVGAFERAATISGVGTVAATGKREVSRSATITGTGSVTAVGDTAEVRTATISGVGSVAASRTIERARSATSAGVGTVAATRTLERARAATITGVGSVAATGGIPGAAPAVDNSDPPITGGGRVMSPGSFPQWWENWEEPQPTEAPPPIPPSFAQLIAEAAAELPMPATPPPAPQPVIRRRRSRMRTTPAVQARGRLQRFTVGEATERMARRQRRQTALLLLMRLLD